MQMNLPNKLTILRACMIPVFLVVLLGGFFQEHQARLFAVIIFAAASITDFLDGYIARKYNLVTNFGKFMDPLADKLLVCAALVALVGIGDLPSWVVVIILSREFIITGFRLVAAEAGLVIAASWWGKIKTVTQMIMIMYVLIGLDGIAFETIKDILIILSTTFTIISGVDYVVKNKDVLNG